MHPFQWNNQRKKKHRRKTSENSCMLLQFCLLQVCPCVCHHLDYPKQCRLINGKCSDIRVKKKHRIGDIKKWTWFFLDEVKVHDDRWGGVDNRIFQAKLNSRVLSYPKVGNGWKCTLFAVWACNCSNSRITDNGKSLMSMDPDQGPNQAPIVKPDFWP